MTRRLEVFVSSANPDLKAHRRAVERVIVDSGYAPIMMEHCSGMSGGAVDECLELVNESDMYVGLLAHRYGFMPEGSDLSITEMEFNVAREKGIPQLCFLVDKKYAWPAEHIEAEPGKIRLINFKKRIKKTTPWALFQSPESLALAVAKALHNLGYPSGYARSIAGYKTTRVVTLAVRDNRASLLIAVEGHLDAPDVTLYLNSVAQLLRVNRYQARILGFSKGSTLLQVRMPLQMANALKLLVSRNGSGADMRGVSLSDVNLSSPPMTIYEHFFAHSLDIASLIADILVRARARSFSLSRAPTSDLTSKHALALALALAFVLASDRDLTRDLASARVLSRALASALTAALKQVYAHDFVEERVFARDLAQALARALEHNLALERDMTHVHDLAEKLTHAREQALERACDIHRIRDFFNGNRVNLLNADLSGADLSGANLAGANLRLVRLVNANLTEANLSHADLNGADLTGAILDGTIFSSQTILPDGSIWRKKRDTEPLAKMLPRQAEMVAYR